MRKSFAIISAIFLVALMFQFTSLIPQAHATGYSYYRAITFEGTDIATASDGSLSNFTVLVCANGASPCNAVVSGLNQSGGGAQVQNSNGYDIVFSTNSSCSSLMSWEMENYVASTGEMEAWVKIPSLTYNTNQTIYMCYGNSGISSFQGGSTGSAWDTSYTAVYHFPNGTTLSANDSTSNGYNGTTHNTPTAVAGDIDGGASFSAASTQYISTADPAGKTFTWNAWFNSGDNGNGNMQTIIGSWDGVTSSTHFVNVGVKYSQVVVWADDDAWSSYGSAVYGDGNWHLLTLTRAGDSTTNGYSVYVDGALLGQTNTGVINVGSATNYIGGGLQSFQYYQTFNGKIDEVGISNVVRSADWIRTEWNNQSDPQSFEGFGSQIAVGSNPTTVSVLVVGGGGGAGGSMGGGGGGGGFIFNAGYPITSGHGYTVTVGGGGTGGSGSSYSGSTSYTTQNGSSSVFDALTALGGGGGGYYDFVAGQSGASGGGGGAYTSSGGSGTAGQGNAGGASYNANWISGGGGGASTAGQAGQSTEPGVGGRGLQNGINASYTYYAGGGGGGGYSGACSGTAAGGGGGGGTGYCGNNFNGTNGTANTGGGGGGGGYSTGVGGNGGSGIVIIAAPTSAGITATGGTHTTANGYDIWTFTSGSVTWTPTIGSSVQNAIFFGGD